MSSAKSWGQWPLIAILTVLLLLNLKGWNMPLFLAIQHYTRAVPDILWANITLLGDTWAALAIVAMFSRYHPRLLWLSVWTLLIAAVFIYTSKLFFQLPRPAGVLPAETLHLIGPALYYRAFPSGHALTAFALAGLLFSHTPRLSLRIGIVLLAALVAISRIAVGAHWPQDIIAGAAIGWLAAQWGIRLGRYSLALHQPLTQALLLGALGIGMVFFLAYDSDYPTVTPLQLGLASAGLWQILRQLSTLAEAAQLKSPSRTSPGSGDDPRRYP